MTSVEGVVAVLRYYSHKKHLDVLVIAMVSYSSFYLSRLLHFISLSFSSVISLSLKDDFFFSTYTYNELDI